MHAVNFLDGDDNNKTTDCAGSVFQRGDVDENLEWQQAEALC